MEATASLTEEKVLCRFSAKFCLSSPPGKPILASAPPAYPPWKGAPVGYRVPRNGFLVDLCTSSKK
jgi:hypothetical protein